MTHAVPITRAGDTQPIRPEAVVLLDPTTGAPVAPAAQGLTDAQLRAAAVPVTLATTPGLTDAQLRAALLRTEPLGKLGGKAYQIAAGATASTSQALTSTVTRLRIYTRNANVRIAVGVGAQTATVISGVATSHFLAADSGMDVACDAGSSISVIRGSDQSVDGIVHVSELT